MSIDAIGERYARNTAVWAKAPLPVFGISDWDGPWQWGSRSDITMPDDSHVTESLGVVYMRDGGERAGFVTVTSHRPDYPQDLRSWVTRNMAIHAVRDRVGDDVIEPRLYNRRIQRVALDLVAGRLPWTAESVVIGCVRHAAEIVAVDDYWSAFVYRLDAHITIECQRISRIDLSLVEIDPSTPSTSSFATLDPITHAVTGRAVLRKDQLPEGA
jgi:hypothetical protein